MDWLIEIDKLLFLFLNGIRAEWLDSTMYLISAKLTWFPLYAVIVFAFFYRKKYQWAIATVVCLALTILAADMGSVHLFKNVFCRLRPSHDPEISAFVNLVNNYRGGQYGFISSHASNCFAFAVYTLLIFRKRWYALSILTWAGIVSYSRIYLGVHYPGDIAGGAVFGSVSAIALWKIQQLITTKFNITPTAKKN